MATPDELATWSPEVMYLRLADFLARWEHLDEGLDCAEATVALWKRLHHFDDRPPLN